jgi:WD40 repeat protein
MDQNKEYFAFISYKREDEDWAKWLAHELEHYHLPLTLNGRDDLPKDLRPIFRDIDELSVGNLPQQINQALENSKNLIVICSPNVAKHSEWVDKEIEAFIKMGKIDRIFPFIIEGVPFAKNGEEECFPKALRDLPQKDEKIAANVSEYKDRPQRLCKDCPLPKDTNHHNRGNINDKGRDAAVVKIVAGMLGLNFDTLWQRYEKEKAEEEQRIKEQRENLLRVQSNFIAEKVNTLVEEGDSCTAKLLALEALPIDLEFPNRPYVSEAEVALRKCAYRRDAILRGHTNAVNSIEFSLDGKHLKSFSETGTKIWEVASGCILPTLNCKSSDYSEDAIIDSNGKVFNRFKQNEKENVSFDGRLIVKSSNSSILIWDTIRNKVLFNLGSNFSLNCCFAFSHDGSMMISCDYIKITLWNMNDGSSINTHRIIDESFFPEHVTFSPNAQNILVSSSKDIKIYSIPNLCLVKTLEGNKSAIFSPDGELIASITMGNIVRIWDSCSYKPSYTITIDNDAATLLVYCPDGENVLSEDGNHNVCMRNIKTGKLLHLYKGLDRPITSAVFSPNGKWLLACDRRKMIVWAVENELVIREINCQDYYNDVNWEYKDSLSIKKAMFSSDGKQILIDGEKAFSIIDIASWNMVKFTLRYPDISDAILTNDGNSVVLATNDYLEIWKEYDDVHLDHEAPGYWLSPDNKRISRVTDSNYEEWQERKKVYLRQEMKGHFDSIKSIACNYDGSLLASATEDTSIRLWNLKKMTETRCLTGHTGEVRTIEFSSNGKLLLSASEDRTVRVWDVETAVELYRIMVEAELNDELLSATFSPDDRWIATISKPIDKNSPMIKVWSFLPLQELIDQTRERFKNRQLTPEERKKYYLE